MEKTDDDLGLKYPEALNAVGASQARLDRLGLTQEERDEIAVYMVNLWLEWREKR